MQLAAAQAETVISTERCQATSLLAVLVLLPAMMIEQEPFDRRLAMPLSLTRKMRVSVQFPYAYALKQHTNASAPVNRTAAYPSCKGCCARYYTPNNNGSCHAFKNPAVCKCAARGKNERVARGTEQAKPNPE